MPLFGAMIISSTTGIVLDLFVSRYEGFALLAVVISGEWHFVLLLCRSRLESSNAPCLAGLPGSVGSIFISRLSTTLHAVALSAAPSGTFRPSKNSAEPSSNLVMIVLILITIPVEIIFLSVLHGLGWLHPPFLFIAFSVVFFCCAASHILSLSTVLIEEIFYSRLPPHYSSPGH